MKQRRTVGQRIKLDVLPLQHVLAHNARIILLLSIWILTVVSPAQSQTPPAKIAEECNCHIMFDNLVSKVESNYVGYHVGVRGKRDTEYRHYTKALRNRAQRTPANKCIFLLQEFVRFFRDGHMFVNEAPQLTDESVSRLTSAAEKVSRDEEEIRRYLDSNATRLDPIEGIWYAKEGYRIGIVRDYKPGRRDFVAIMLSESVQRWTPGQVKAEFRRLPDRSYDVVFYSGRHYPLHLSVYLRGQQGGAAIRRGLLLHMPPITWGKAYPLKPDERDLLDPVDPRRPTIRLIGQSTVVVSVPSHSPEHAPVLNGLVEKFRERILNAENLIIDIRGDEGGSSGMTRALMPFFITKSKRPSRSAGGKPVVVSSPDNIAYFEQMQSQGWVPAHLVERMKANPGKVVFFEDPDPADSAPIAATDDTATPRPRNVAILMDGAVTSAGEAFVLAAMKNEKVTLFGENTGGVIDYQNVTISSVPGCPALGISLGYPTIAASDRLPTGGINARGIPPDVRIGRGVTNPIQFIIDYYARREKR